MLLTKNSSITSTTSKPLRVRRRSDLVTVETRHRNESAVIVKDPVAMKYHRLRHDEFFVLQQLDGQKSLDQIRESYGREFAPKKVTSGNLNRLLFRFHRGGLTLSDTAMQGDRLRDRHNDDRRQRWTQQLSGILFIRFPGVDPEPLLKRIYPLVRPMTGRLGFLLAAMLCLIASITLLTQWPVFAAEFPAMSEWARWDSLLILAAVVGCTKVCHELGHALACKHFGGECHEIGPMLLVFTPALYCDTSDSWMLPSRWQRAAVGMAGIATEMMLAALAVLVWVSTGPGLIHYLAMNVMVVCSVSTLFFNANPLLRYDGYYVLSDLCDVPNLGERSRRLLAGHSNRILFGVNEVPPESVSHWGSFWMLGYAVAATVYRWLLMFLILWIVAAMLRPFGLESAGRVLCGFAACGLAFNLIRPIHRFLSDPSRRRRIRLQKTAISTAALAVLAACTFVPLPSGVSSSARLIPRAETPIYVSTIGSLDSILHQPGETVREGDEIAKLVNHNIELQYLIAKGRYESQKQRVTSMRRMAVATPNVANDLPAQEALLDDLHTQLQTRKSRWEALTIVAPASGKLIAAPRRPEPNDTSHRLVSWSGYPTEARNQSCLMEPGHELMSIVSDENWDAEFILSQFEVQRVEVGARVKLVLESAPERKCYGTVTDISRSEWTREQNRERRDHVSASKVNQPRSTSYVVRVELETSHPDFVTGAGAVGRIETPSLSIAARSWRMINGLFRLR